LESGLKLDLLPCEHEKLFMIVDMDEIILYDSF